MREINFSKNDRDAEKYSSVILFWMWPSSKMNILVHVVSCEEVISAIGRVRCLINGVNSSSASNTIEGWRA